MRRILGVVAFFSLLINLLGLSGSFFMLQVYDRVIPSGSIPTLVALSALVALLYGFYGFLDIMRSRVLVRLGHMVEATFDHRVFAIISGMRLKSVNADALRPAREMDQVKQFVGGAGLAMLFDLPWLPFYLAICFFLSPLIGFLAVAAIALLAGFNLAAGIKTRALTKQHTELLVRRNRLGEASSRNAELLAAMGMTQRAALEWEYVSGDLSSVAKKLSDTSGFYAGLSKIIRNAVQSAALGLGAYLVIRGELSGGSIIAGSIIVARTLAPIEQMIAHWRGLLQAQQAWKRLKGLMSEFPEEPVRVTLPAPCETFIVENLHVALPGQKLPTISNINLKAAAGTVVGVIGPSGSGKSTFARAVVGVWPILRGRVSLDGAGLEQWPPSSLGNHIGFMPQSSDFFPGTIASNIARLDPAAAHEAIVAAAKSAGAHEMIVGLPDGYDTQIGADGAGLSAGQRQRIALARALFGQPFLVVLDEPNSNLDAEGDLALVQAVRGVRDRGGIAVVIAHRKSIMSEVDFLLVIEQGAAKAFGPRDAVLKALHQQQQRVAAHRSAGPALAVIENGGRSDGQ